MIKAVIKGAEIRLLKNGTFKCKNRDLLELAEQLSEIYDPGSDYQPDVQHGLMIWICEKLGGKITHLDPDDSKYPEPVCFASPH